MNTHEIYVSLEVAKLLKQVGFDWDYVKAYFTGWGDNFEYGTLITIGSERGSVIPEDALTPAPTLAVAQRWLRKVKNIFVEVTRYETINPLARELFEAVYDKTVDQSFAYGVNVLDANNESIYDEDCFLTYEEAQEAGIKKALKIILEKRE